MRDSLCMIGDSVTKGVVLDEVKNKYIFLKESFLNLVTEKADAKIVNYSKFGCTVTKGAEILKKHIEEISTYDHIALEFGGNDCDFDWNEVSSAPEDIHLPHTPIDEFIEKYRGMIKKIRDYGGTPVIINLPPLEPLKFFRWVSKGLNEDNILRWLADVETIFRHHESYNDAVCRLARLESVLLVDVRSEFLRRKDYASLICDDGMHPNAKGHEIMSEVMRRYALC